jgi:hypothetical protein
MPEMISQEPVAVAPSALRLALMSFPIRTEMKDSASLIFSSCHDCNSPSYSIGPVRTGGSPPALPPQISLGLQISWVSGEQLRSAKGKS